MNWQDALVSNGETLGDLTDRTKVLLVFLRHFG